MVRVDTRAERRADPTGRFDELFRRLYPRLYDLCHRLLVDRWEAEDVVQEAFLRLVGAAVIDRPDQEVEAWLRRVCVNLGYNRLRGQRRGRERLERASAELPPGAVATERDDPLGSLLRLEQQAMVHRALWTLPERQRTCLLLRHAGYTYAEIADTCEASCAPGSTAQPPTRPRSAPTSTAARPAGRSPRSYAATPSWPRRPPGSSPRPGRCRRRRWRPPASASRRWRDGRPPTAARPRGPGAAASRPPAPEHAWPAGGWLPP